MYIVIEKDKSNALKHKARKLKELACDMMDCLEGRRYDEDYDNYDDDDYSRDDRRGMRPRY